MGQRLNIEIIENGEALANAYYHWSGYTSSAFYLVGQILEETIPVENPHPVARAVLLLEATGSGLTDDEFDALKEILGDDYDRYEFQATNGRNIGLTAVSKKGMDDTRHWEEARMEVDLTNEEVRTAVTYEESVEDYKEYYEEDPSDAPTLNVDIGTIPFDKFLEVSSLVQQYVKDGVYALKIEGEDSIVSFIE